MAEEVKDPKTQGNVKEEEHKDAEGQGWFSPNCPYCGSSHVVCTNKAQKLGAFATAGAVALVANAILPGAGTAAGAAMGISAAKGICKTSHYICVDCKKEFSKGFMT
ncbi:MAG: hypothetical protein IKO40_00735 [Kiritimatiellae bacterium]|nr:hypothetical protein [Kiritimatiellia bacterium]